MEEWKEYQLGDVCSRLSSGKNISASKISSSDVYPVFGGNGLRGYTDNSNFTGECAIIGRQGAFCGNVRFFSGEAYMTEHAVVVCGNEKANTRYLSYLLSTMNLGRLSGQSAQLGLAVGTLAKQLIKLPPLPTQQKIAAILSSLDDKIELNNKINTNLEQQAQALFKNWFVDKSDLYQKMPLGKVVSKANVGGDAIKKTPIVEEDTGIRCIRIGDLTNKRPYKEWGFAKVSDENFIRYKLHKYDIVLARTAVLGLNRIIYEDLNAVYNNGMIKLEANPKIILPLFLYCQMNTQDYKNYMNRIVAETSVRPNMKANYLLDYQLIVPDIETQKRFEKIAKGIYEQINNNEKENDRLSSLRDTLLPKLMNGEIEV